MNSRVLPAIVDEYLGFHPDVALELRAAIRQRGKPAKSAAPAQRRRDG
jgi:hypothetical protein